MAKQKTCRRPPSETSRKIIQDAFKCYSKTTQYRIEVKVAAWDYVLSIFDFSQTQFPHVSQWIAEMEKLPEHDSVRRTLQKLIDKFPKEEWGEKKSPTF